MSGVWPGAGGGDHRRDERERERDGGRDDRRGGGGGYERGGDDRRGGAHDDRRQGGGSSGWSGASRERHAAAEAEGRDYRADLPPSSMPTIDDTNNRIYVSGLAPGTNKDDLIELFGRIGMIAKKREHKRQMKHEWPYAVKMYSNNDASLMYEDPMAAQSAPGFFNGHEFKGAKIKVEMAEKKAAPPGGWSAGGGSYGGRGGGRGGGGRGYGRGGGGRGGGGRGGYGGGYNRY